MGLNEHIVRKNMWEKTHFLKWNLSIVHTDKKSLKLAIHSTLKSLSHHQRHLRLDREELSYIHRGTLASTESGVCVCVHGEKCFM